MLKAYISKLVCLNRTLKREYDQVRTILILQIVLLCVIYLGAALLIRSLEEFQAESSHYMPFILIASIYTAIHVLFKRVYNPILTEFRKIYQEAQHLSDLIVDEADWSNFRKRDLENNTRSQAINTVEELYYIRNKRFFPTYTLRSFYPAISNLLRVLNILILIETLLVFIFTLFPNSHTAIKIWLNNL